MGRMFPTGRMHDQTAIKSEGIDGLLRDYPNVNLEMGLPPVWLTPMVDSLQAASVKSL